MSDREGGEKRAAGSGGGEETKKCSMERLKTSRRAKPGYRAKTNGVNVVPGGGEKKYGRWKKNFLEISSGQHRHYHVFHVDRLRRSYIREKPGRKQREGKTYLGW